MYKQLSLVLVALLLGSCANHKGNKSTPQDQAKQTKAYQATYSVPAGGLFSEEKIISDGNGLFRMDAQSASPLLPNIVSVLDQNKKEVTVWQEGKNVRKFFGHRPVQPIDPIVMMVSVGSVSTSKDAKPLGAKTINGRNCHGWKGALGSEAWIDDDYGCYVQGTSGSATLTLSSFSTTAPDEAMFKPPAGYVDAATLSTRGAEHASPSGDH